MMLSTLSRLRADIRFYARVLRYFTTDWPYVLLTLVFIVMATLSALLLPFPLAILINYFQGKPNGGGWAFRLFNTFTPTDPIGKIIALAAATLALRLLQEL